MITDPRCAASELVGRFGAEKRNGLTMMALSRGETMSQNKADTRFSTVAVPDSLAGAGRSLGA
jgi:hypothetical protein